MEFICVESILDGQSVSLPMAKWGCMTMGRILKKKEHRNPKTEINKTYYLCFCLSPSKLKVNLPVGLSLAAVPANNESYRESRDPGT